MANDNQRIRYTKEQIEAAFNKGVEQFEEDQEKEAAKLKAEAEAKRKEELKKKAAPPPPKYYYDVKVECMLPAVLTYRVLAEDPYQAAELIRGKSPNSVQHKLVGRKELMLKVYDASGSMMRFMKKLLG
jgi:Mg-chelatase subunit ChlD